MRQYTALLDDGHDYKEFTYYSVHKNGSKANREDCKNQYKQVYGKWCYNRINWNNFTSQRQIKES